MNKNKLGNIKKSLKESADVYLHLAILLGGLLLADSILWLLFRFSLGGYIEVTAFVTLLICSVVSKQNEILVEVIEAIENKYGG